MKPERKKVTEIAVYRRDARRELPRRREKKEGGSRRDTNQKRVPGKKKQQRGMISSRCKIELLL